jgi:hypothetical protein
MICNISGNELLKCYDVNGKNSLSAFDINGEKVFTETHYNTFSILGDSMSTFANCIVEGNLTWYPKSEETNDVQNVEETWWHIFGEEYGCLIDTNNSYSGSTISYDSWGSGTNDGITSSFVGRMTNLGNPELIFVFGGTNDNSIINNYGGSIGEYKYADWTDEDLTTFRPALSYLLNYLKEHHTTSQILFLISPYISTELKDSIRVVCNFYEVPYVDLNRFATSGGHPNKEGMITIKNDVIQYLTS